MTIKISQHALALYFAAQTSEFHCVIALALDTKDLQKKERQEYRRIVADTYGVSLKTMENRGSVALKMQTKFAATLAAYLECNEVNVLAVAAFMQSEMNKAHSKFNLHLEDINRFLSGKKPERVEREEAAEEAAKAAEVRRAAIAEAERIQAEAAAKNASDTSGTPAEPSQATPQESATIGHADKSENRNPTPAATVPMPEDKEDFLLLVTEDAEGKMIVEGLEEMSIEHIKALAATLMRELDKREPVAKKEKKRA